MKRVLLFLGAMCLIAVPRSLEAQILIYDSGDTFVSQHTPNSNYNNSSDQTPVTTDLLEIKTDAAAGDYNRIGYLQFDLSAYNVSQFTGTTLTLNLGSSPSGTLMPGHTWTLNLYGLDPAAATSAATLGVGSMTWNDTVTNIGTGYTGFHNASGSAIINATLLGTITVTDTGAGTVWNISGAALDNYLATVGTTAAFVINRTDGTTNGTAIHTIYNSSAGSLAPSLTIQSVPEPGLALLLFCGLIPFALVRFYRRAKENSEKF